MDRTDTAEASIMVKDRIHSGFCLKSKVKGRRQEISMQKEKYYFRSL